MSADTARLITTLFGAERILLGRILNDDVGDMTELEAITLYIVTKKGVYILELADVVEGGLEKTEFCLKEISQADLRNSRILYVGPAIRIVVEEEFYFDQPIGGLERFVLSLRLEGRSRTALKIARSDIANSVMLVTT